MKYFLEIALKSSLNFVNVCKLARFLTIIILL